jgi:acyl-homoserine-lactone acylase
VALAAVVLSGCGRGGEAAPPAPPAATFSADIARTSHGVVHVRAAGFRGLGYGLAYSYAQDNVCMFADSLLTARGERSLFFGPEAPATRSAAGEYGAASDFMDLKNEDSDFFFKGYLDIDELKAGYAAGSQEARDFLAGYAAGYNRYLKDYAGKMPAACNRAAWVRPIALEDMYLVLAEKALHASGQVFAKEIVAGARDPGVVAPVLAHAARGRVERSFMKRRLAQLAPAGRNGAAIGEDSRQRAWHLLGNPHYPWIAPIASIRRT